MKSFPMPAPGKFDGKEIAFQDLVREQCLTQALCRANVANARLVLEIDQALCSDPVELPNAAHELLETLLQFQGVQVAPKAARMIAAFQVAVSEAK